MAIYIVRGKVTGQYYATNHWAWGINNATRFSYPPSIDHTCKILEIKPDGKLVEVR
jgi:hypothetical protein